jgi:hypothetical protein
MDVQAQIEGYIAGQPEPKQGDMWALHAIILRLMPGAKLWFLDGRDSAGKVVSNPNVGYGSDTIHYKDGKTREFYQIGLSANTTGLSVYVMGIADKQHLARLWRADRQGERQRLLHQVQGARGHRRRCARRGDPIRDREGLAACAVPAGERSR